MTFLQVAKDTITMLIAHGGPSPNDIGSPLASEPQKLHSGFISPSSSSAFPAQSLGFTIFGETFVYVTIFLIQPQRWSHSVFVDGACWVFLLLALTI